MNDNKCICPKYDGKSTSIKIGCPRHTPEKRRKPLLIALEEMWVKHFPKEETKSLGWDSMPHELLLRKIQKVVQLYWHEYRIEQEAWTRKEVAHALTQSRNQLIEELRKDYEEFMRWDNQHVIVVHRTDWDEFMKGLDAKYLQKKGQE